MEYTTLDNEIETIEQEDGRKEMLYAVLVSIAFVGICLLAYLTN